MLLKRPLGKKMTWGLIILALLIAEGILSLVFTVDDWSRDFTTNVAETDPAHREFLLRPLVSEAELGEVASVVRAAVEKLPRWELTREGRYAETLILYCVRTTRLLRFKDDIVIRIEDQGDERVVSVTSSSRIGKGDFGQNPRNIKELFAELRGKPAFEEGPEV